MPLSAHAKDTYVAPQMSQFTAATIRDMTATSAENIGCPITFSIRSFA
jgi:hypothetical protein